jgi:hypothetical protein
MSYKHLRILKGEQMKYIYTLLTLITILFVSNVSFGQDVTVKSYQNWLYQSNATPNNKVESGHFNFDEAYLGFTKTSGAFNFEAEVKANSNFDLTLEQAFVGYSNKLSTDWKYSVKGGRFNNAWYDYTTGNTYTYSRPLISVFIPEHSSNGVQFGINNGATNINIAYFNGNADTSKRIFVTSTFKPSETLEIGLFGQAKLNYTNDTGYVFGASINDRSYSESFGGIKYGAEFMYSKNTINSYLASIKAEYYPAAWKRVSIFAQGIYMIPNTTTTENYNLAIQTDLVWRPINSVDIAFEYRYDWSKRVQGTGYSYTTGIRTGFRF